MHKIARNYLRIKYIFAVILAVLIACAMMMTVSIFDRERVVKSDYSGGWVTGMGSLVNINSFDTTEHGGRTELYNTLPDSISYGDALCFIGQNVKFKIYVDGELLYEYDQAPNLTGNGYGLAYHTVTLCPDMAGKVISFDIDSVFYNHERGRLRKVSIENAQAYRARSAKGLLLPYNISIGVLCLGFIILFLRLILPYKESQPSLLALGINAVITGVWLANDTGYLRLSMDVVRLGRVTDYICMHIWILPLLLFIYSVTRQRRKLYMISACLLTGVDVVLFLIFRYVCGLEPAFMEWHLIIYYLLAVILISLMLVNDAKYCKASGTAQGHRIFFIGLSGLAVSAMVDILIYLSGARYMSGRGGFARIGFLAFYVMMALDVIYAWMKEQTAVKSDRIINKILQIAVSSTDPEVSIRSIIEYFGREFGAPHTYIYENRNDGTFHNTYEWYAEDAERPDNTDYYDIPYAGLIDKLYDVFMKDHRLIVDDSEETRRLNPVLHSLMTKLRIRRMVVGPLQVNNELIGLFGVDDAPKERSTEMADIIWLMSYFVTQLILQRNEKRDLVRYSFVDSLTGAGNRRAMVEFEVNRREFRPYGFVMCDINGLKKTNDTYGHEAGDRLIIDVAHSLTDVFGADNVYRMGGDEFAAYAFTGSQEEFDSMMSHVRSLVEAKGRSASFGAVYVTDDKMSAAEIREQADRLMYREKEEYYNGANDRRSRQ